MPQKLLKGEGHREVRGAQHQMAELRVKRLSLEEWEWSPE
jgi:hypothetical protein